MLRHWKKSEIILLVLLSAVLIYSGVSIGRYFYDGYSSRALNEEFRKEYYQLRHADSGDPVDPFESLFAHHLCFRKIYTQIIII
jgi:hypothetical protein